MDDIQNYELRKTNSTNDEYTLVVFLDDNLTEFADEFNSAPKAKQNLTTTIKQIIKIRYPNLKITMVKVMLSGAVVTTFSISDFQSQVHAAESNVSTSEVPASSSIYYHVGYGDSLWTISRKFNTSVELIKQANKLNSDTLQVNQPIIIPKAIHTVGVGDYLTVLARDYQVPVDVIKAANGLSTNATKLGQTLIIPTLISSSPSNSTSSQPAVQTSTYTVVSGDSLSVIAKRFGTTVEALRSANNLSSDFLRVGQTLEIPTSGSGATNQAPFNSATYTIVSGDSLSVIAKRFGTTVEALRSANNLSSDFLRVGQTLKIPTSGSGATNQAPSNSGTYTVVSGDSLSVIAKRFGTSVEALRSMNNLSSDFLRVGQTLKIPTSGSGATNQAPSNSATYTVVSGDSLSVIAKRFAITVEALRSANRLSSDFLRVGQTLKIPTSGSGATNQAPSNSATYTVVSGDSLSVIAKRFGTSVDALRSANNLSSDFLRVGQTLKIPTNKQTTPTPPQPETSKEKRATFVYPVQSGDSLSVIARRFGVTTDAIRSANKLKSDALQVGQALTIPNGIHEPTRTGANTITYKTHTIKSGDNIWDLSVRYGIPQQELLRANNLTTSSRLSLGQTLKIPVHNIAVKPVASAKHGEYLDWWTEAQYVFTIGKKAKVTDVATGKSFYIKRTIGANHADSETVTTTDSKTAKSIWGGFSWTPRAVIVEVDGRKLAGSMSFMPHEREYIKNNGITGHFDVYFGNSTRHVDGKADPSHQAQVRKAAGLR